MLHQYSTIAEHTNQPIKTSKGSAYKDIRHFPKMYLLHMHMFAAELYS